MFDYTRVITARAVLALAAGIAVIADSTIDRGVKQPATSTTPALKDFQGVTLRASAAAGPVELVCIPGDSVQARASGAVTRGDRVYIDTAAGKEGAFKKFTGFGTDGAQLVVGIAQTTCADGELFELKIEPVFVGDGFQAGVATLVSGTVTVSNVVLTANSRIGVWRKTAGGTAGTGGLYAPSANRNTGAGTMELRSADTAGAVVATDTSVVDWMIIG